MCCHPPPSASRPDVRALVCHHVCQVHGRRRDKRDGHAELASSYTFKSPEGRFSARAHATEIAAFHWLAVVNAHAVLPSSCALKAPVRSCAGCAYATVIAAFYWVAVAKAHAVLATFCTLE